MDKIEIEGIKRLEGKIKISGSKNSSLPILASSLLVNSKIALSNVPRLTDVYFMLKILESLNCNVSFKDNDCEIIPTKPKKCKVYSMYRHRHYDYDDCDYRYQHDHHYDYHE